MSIMRYGASFAKTTKTEPAPQVYAPPRRTRRDQMVPAELAISHAMDMTEQAGCDPLLTDAVVLLQQARDKVADYVDALTAKQTLVMGNTVASQGAR